MVSCSDLRFLGLLTTDFALSLVELSSDMFVVPFVERLRAVSGFCDERGAYEIALLSRWSGSRLKRLSAEDSKPV